ncbi:E3 ubiquitin-protein ligase PPP1R11 isoform X1 [Leptopilina heterotoma]|uniref:E3 ubiquitin-protein ligase PPP1R11 isoform X1 n=1 Tax=Leptopilina heterotoma TaxID=63436 RepID=UPI001CAA137E|nr:E3 ubiquitin-protein ligase PPP1R11 isoform X1 [Leptopilina heterotoma]
MERVMITGQSSQTETICERDVTDAPQEVPTVHLRLRKPRSSKKVQWTQGTVDNEDLNKKKSKCCCIYEKPKAFGESSSDESDDECEHCHGHKDDHKKILPINKPDNPSAEIPHSERRQFDYFL